MIVKLIVSIIFPLLAGFIGSVFTTPAIDSWYVNLNKPFFNPPSWLFGPAWTILYISMGIAFYLYWRETNKISKIFLIQLVLNSLWSIIFFGLKMPFLAFIEIVFLWLAIFKTMQEFKKVSRPAFYLLVPYLAWVSFAALLNFSIFLLN